MEANAQKRYRRLDVSESGLRLERGFTEATISSHLARVLRETFGQWISPEMTGRGSCPATLGVQEHRDKPDEGRSSKRVTLCISR